MSALLSNYLTIAASEIDRVRNDIMYADSSAIHHSPVIRDRSARMVASSYIWLAATLEQYTKSVVESLLVEINSSGILYSQLKPCLFSLACANDFESVQDLRGLKMWHKRVDLFARYDDGTAVGLSLSRLPIDGRTIRPEHLDTIWRVFGVAGQSLPSPRHRFALLDIADGRNQVAHGELTPIQFGRTKVLTDVKRAIEYIEEIILHIDLAMSAYLLSKDYQR